MGGRGSGRSSSYGFNIEKCHEYHCINLAWLQRKKLLNVGRWSTITWLRAGHETGPTRVECLTEGVRLIYRDTPSAVDAVHRARADEIGPLAGSRRLDWPWS